MRARCWAAAAACLVGGNGGVVRDDGVLDDGDWGPALASDGDSTRDGDSGRELATDGDSTRDAAREPSGLAAALHRSAARRSTWRSTAPGQNGAGNRTLASRSLAARQRGRHAGASRTGVASDLVLILLCGDTSEDALPLCNTPWPQRLELALATLVALESTLGSSPKALFEVHVVLAEDSFESPGLDFGKGFHRCDAYREWGINSDFRRTQSANCDVVQMLRNSNIPHTIVPAAAFSLKPLAPVISKYDRVAVVHGAGVLVAAAAINTLFGRLEYDGAADAFAALHPASASLSGPRLHRAERKYAVHPLNFARTDEVLREVASHSKHHVDSASLSGTNAKHRVFATTAAKLLGVIEAHDKNSERPLLDFSRWLKLGGLGVGEVQDAYAYSALQVEDLLLGSDAPSSAAAVSSPRPAKKRVRSPVLLAVTCAGVWPRTLTALLSLEGHTRDSFDVIVAVTPRGKDKTADFLESARIEVLRQGEANGLTDLWNKVFQFALQHEYAKVVFANNDVLVADGAISAMANALSNHRHISSAITKQGGAASYFFHRGTPEEERFTSFPLNWKRTQFEGRPQRSAWARGIAKQTLKYYTTGESVYYRMRTFTAFFFALDMEWATQNPIAAQAPKRFWNDSRWKNYGQEAELVRRTKEFVWHVDDAFVYHFRGATLPAYKCANGHLDCATWQKDHRADGHAGRR